ncbi:MAG: PilZ domain-containing protein [Candidatus Omnitrophica bacterium]|nr:PilZ domain-containing protein [Candidatus Omnitrophota bacterium]MBU4302909.1 PilZ domain-containing protein [Candidatus Omnitrophota bacterium]MBU4418652.1 PilZ domain-containing protein [Candidatus Omnitrophota bacterium]MBU4468327.1 PilZ domain-containing protein [Candidatus Omnitrophota bacterium]MCG2707197.1 PilZ domain-containing protein [Candidatus Omnitrophota bacterium]
MEDKHSDQNRRKSERLDTAFTLIYRVEKPLALRIQLGFAVDIDALMLNLSDSGMAIITRHDLPAGTQLFIKFNIIDLCLQGDERWRHMEMAGEVVSNVFLPDSSHRIGIRFDRISDADKLAISNFVKRNKLLPA